MNTQGTDEHSVTVGLPKYELIDKNGRAIQRFERAEDAAKYAKLAWPDQQQDTDRLGLGWDVEAVR